MNTGNRRQTKDIRSKESKVSSQKLEVKIQKQKVRSYNADEKT